jgi:putative addiction module killer protein
VLPSNVPEVRYYLSEDGRSPFIEWFESLDSAARVRVATAIERLAAGNISGLKAVGEGVVELRIFFGPGYRVYLGREGAHLIIVLAGGTKQRQQKDIESARLLWEKYKKRARSKNAPHR